MNRRNFLKLNTWSQADRWMQPQWQNGAALQNKATSIRNINLTDQQLASRFLAQATMGANMMLIDEVANVGIEAWLEQQFAISQTETVQYMWDAIQPIYQLEDQPLLGLAPFRWAWWQAVMTGEDQLRQRLAMALSEIFVVSTKTDFLEDLSLGIGSWYDMLLKNAFGNFRDLLFDVTMHPVMGYYLSHAGNRKADPSTNRFPDENYAREVMQLFSIGLFELNLDGSRKLDENGEPIATYNNADISEFAKIFTGLVYQRVEWFADEFEEEGGELGTEEEFITREPSWENITKPMEMWDSLHESGEKRLLNDAVVSSGQTGMQDVNDAVDNLFNHLNVGPFMARLLIQRLVKSHPSSGYIERVATAFNEGTFNGEGSGTRGDMQAVVKAILLDDEAREPSFINEPTHGMLREPFIRYTQLCRAFEAKNENGENLFYNYAEYSSEQLGQYPFASPSVFNFFSPDFRPLGPLEQANINAPEFQLMTSVSAVKVANFWEDAIWEGDLMELPEEIEETDDPEEKLPTISPVFLDLEPYEPLEGDVDALIDRLDLLLTYGTLSNDMRTIMSTTLTALYGEIDDWGDVIRFALVLFMNCPDYTIQK
ncbi:MAG: DUF1800 family protein [Chloroflexota bacterium]